MALLEVPNEMVFFDFVLAPEIQFVFKPENEMELIAAVADFSLCENRVASEDGGNNIAIERIDIARDDAKRARRHEKPRVDHEHKSTKPRDIRLRQPNAADPPHVTVVEHLLPCIGDIPSRHRDRLVFVQRIQLQPLRRLLDFVLKKHQKKLL